MRAFLQFAAIVAALVCALPSARADEVLFADDFEKGLSDKWQIVGMEKTDYRLRDGGLELRVQSGEFDGKLPMIKVMLPFTSDETAEVSVRVTPLDEFTEEGELAGVFLLDATGREFAAKKQRVEGRLVFAPGKYTFAGKPGEEGDPAKFKVTYTDAAPEAGPLRIIADRGNAFFSVGPADKNKDEYLGFFHSALGDSKERGFCLCAEGGPKDKEHWVRFDDFRVIKH